MKVKIDAQATLGHIVRVLGACIVGVEGCFVQSDDVLRFLSELEVEPPSAMSLYVATVWARESASTLIAAASS